MQLKTVLVFILAFVALALAQSNRTTSDPTFSSWANDSKGVSIGMALPGGAAGNDLIIGTFDGSTWTSRVTLTNTGYLYIPTRLFADLGTPTNGAMVYCSNCTVANPCATGGTGALAKRLNNAWRCN